MKFHRSVGLTRAVPGRALTGVCNFPKIATFFGSGDAGLGGHFAQNTAASKN